MNPNQLKLLAESYSKTFDLTSLRTMQFPELIDWCAKQIEEDWSLNEDKVKLHRVNFMKIPEAKPDDYSVFIDTFKDLTYMHGIRHFNGNPNRPFVDIRLSDYSKIEEKIARLNPIIREQYAKFSPTGLRINLSPKTVSSLSVEHQVFQKWLVASNKNIRQNELPVNYDIIQLRQVMNQGYFPIYQRHYAAFHKEFPELIDDVSVNNLQTMEGSRNDGLLFEILVNQEPAGFIAGEKDAIFGESAIYFNEIVLHPKFKGKKLAAAAQRKFLELNSINEKLVWGTIDSKNLPSLKTALSVGRKVVLEEVFFPI